MFTLSEPLHFEQIVAGDVVLWPDYDRRDALANQKALLWRSTALAIESAFRFGVDLPVGASIADGERQVAGFFASDMRVGQPEFHAERYALFRAQAAGVRSRILAVTMEPCTGCQEEISRQKVELCSFVLSRKDVASKGLVNDRPGILDWPEQETAPYYMQLVDPTLTAINLAVLDAVSRDKQTGSVQVDQATLFTALTEFDEITPSPFHKAY